MLRRELVRRKSCTLSVARSVLSLGAPFGPVLELARRAINWQLGCQLMARSVTGARLAIRLWAYYFFIK
jgi:hypothetical protein